MDFYNQFPSGRGWGEEKDIDPGFYIPGNPKDIDPGFSIPGQPWDLDPGFDPGAQKKRNSHFQELLRMIPGYDPLSELTLSSGQESKPNFRFAGLFDQGIVDPSRNKKQDNFGLYQGGVISEVNRTYNPQTRRFEMPRSSGWLN